MGWTRDHYDWKLYGLGQCVFVPTPCMFSVSPWSYTGNVKHLGKELAKFRLVFIRIWDVHYILLVQESCMFSK